MFDLDDFFDLIEEVLKDLPDDGLKDMLRFYVVLTVVEKGFQSLQDVDVDALIRHGDSSVLA